MRHSGLKMGTCKLAKLKALRPNCALTDVRVFRYGRDDNYYTAAFDDGTTRQRVFIKIAYKLLQSQVIERELFWHRRAAAASQYVMPLVGLRFTAPDGQEVPCIATPYRRKTVQSADPLPRKRFYAHLAYAARGLMDLHETTTQEYNGMVQRDVKAENMVIDGDSLETRLIDFGPALGIGTADPLAPRTYTPGREPPELAAARVADVDIPGHPCQDAYAFAATLEDNHLERYGPLRGALREAIEGNLCDDPEKRLGMAPMLDALQRLAGLRAPPTPRTTPTPPRSQEIYVRELVEAL